MLPEIEKTSIVEVYVHYDRPLLYTCQNRAGQKFICVLAEEDDEDNEVWLYAPMSQRRFEMVRSGGIDLKTAFSSSETGYAYVIKVKHTGETDSDTIPNERIPVFWLPKIGHKLNLPTETLPAPSSIETL